MKYKSLLRPLAVGLAVCMLLVAGHPAQGLLTAQPAPSASEQLMAMMVAINAQLEASGADFRVDRAEYLTLDNSAEVGQTVFFTDRGNKQIDAHFVAGDPRRGGRTDITYIVDQQEGAIDGLTTPQTTAAIDRGMTTWQGVNCSDIPITKLPDVAGDLGFIELLNGLGGSPIVYADITHAGWLPGGILPSNIIAVTFTFIFVSGVTPTDIDSNGKLDVAFREILYNDLFGWQINGDFDVETVALHEAGHGLSQAHFGALFQTSANGKFHFAPRAVMNAGYTGVQQNIKATDNAGHCSIWASWPNN